MEFVMGRQVFRCVAGISRLSFPTTIPRQCVVHNRYVSALEPRSQLFESFTKIVALRDLATNPKNYSYLSAAKRLTPCQLYSGRCFATDTNNDGPSDAQKQTIFQKMKQLTKDYWHILIPVHVVTSIGWLALFYCAAKNGVDIVAILEKLHVSEKYVEAVRGSKAGFWAIAYALYKIFTPLRYTVTVGGTTLSIRYLNRWGYLKWKPLGKNIGKSQSDGKTKQTDFSSGERGSGQSSPRE